MELLLISMPIQRYVGNALMEWQEIFAILQINVAVPSLFVWASWLVKQEYSVELLLSTRVCISEAARRIVLLLHLAEICRSPNQLQMVWSPVWGSDLRVWVHLWLLLKGYFSNKHQKSTRAAHISSTPLPLTQLHVGSFLAVRFRQTLSPPKRLHSYNSQTN